MVIVFAGVRLLRQSASALVDEAPPPEEMDRIEAAIARARSGGTEIVGYHKLRARTTGRRLYIDMHVQYRSGTTLERAHELAHELRDAIESDLGDAEVLIHVEPESSRHDPAESPRAFRAG
jgi:divalent metal cation (Fe/Co/Zn/Cd) transporter